MTTPPETLAGELYWLAQERYGASIEAIMRCRILMSLPYIRAAAGPVLGGDAQRRAIAKAARERVTDATDAIPEQITQRQSENANNPLAARFLLGLEQDSGRWHRKKREEHAAAAGDVLLESALKIHSEKGNYFQKLIKELAGAMFQRNQHHTLLIQEAGLDSSFAEIPLPAWIPPPLPDYHRAWLIAHRIPDYLKMAIECVRRRSADHHPTPCGRCLPALANYIRLSTITVAIDEPDYWQRLSKTRFPARPALRRIQAATPFDPTELEEAKQALKDSERLGEFASSLDGLLLMRWDGWLRKCKCLPELSKSNPACGVHQVMKASIEYASIVEDEWRSLQTALQALHPSDFLTQTDDVIYGRIGLPVPGR